MNRLLLAGALLCVVGGSVQSQPVVFSGELRHRTEIDDRALPQPTDARMVHLLRTRLAAAARPSPRIRVYAQIQDARVWGSESSFQGLGTLDGSADQLDMHQAYAEIDSIGGAPVNFRIGRQEIAHGDERLIGAVGWSNVGRSFDAARLRWNGGIVAAEVFAAQLETSTRLSGPQAVGGGIVTWTPAPTQTLEVFAYADADAMDVPVGRGDVEWTRTRGTFGTRAVGRAGALGVDASLIGQTGAIATRSGAPRDEIRAWLGSAEVSVTRGVAGFVVGATHLSGDDDPTDGVDHRFDTLFATNHKFYGAMDYLPALSGSSGFNDLYVAVSGAPVTRWSVGCQIHVFAMSAAPPGAHSIGQELDLTVRHQFAETSNLALGFSAFRPGEVFATDDIRTWAYIMASFGF